MYTASPPEAGFKYGKDPVDIKRSEENPTAEVVTEDVSMEEEMESVASQFEETGEVVLGFVRQRPLVAVACATAAGFLIGRAFSK